MPSYQELVDKKTALISQYMDYPHQDSLVHKFDTSVDSLLPVITKIDGDLIGYNNIGLRDAHVLLKKMELALSSLKTGKVNILFHFTWEAIEAINGFKKLKAYQ